MAFFNKTTLAALVLLIWVCIVSGCFDRRVTVWDQARAHNGVTVFNVMTTYSLFGIINAVNMDGTLAWEFVSPTTLPIWEMEVLPNGNLLVIGGYRIYEIADPACSGDIIWHYGEYGEMEVHHDLDVLSDGKLIFLYYDMVRLPDWGWTISDGIKIYDRENDEIVWDWRAIDHLPTNHHCSKCIQNFWIADWKIGRDWTHSNSITFDEEDSAIYLNLRNLNQIVKIGYPSGEILWILGDSGDFGEGLLHHAHDPEFLPNGNILLFDNGIHSSIPAFGSRVIEIAYESREGTADVVWQYCELPPVMDTVLGDADRLPNGNTLITSGTHGRLVEVTPAGRKVWELQLSPGIKNRIYKAERL